MLEEDFPLEVTFTPDSEVTDLDEVLLDPFKNFNKACLSPGVTSSDDFEWLRPAFCIRSIRALSSIFKVFAKSLTVMVNLSPS